VRREDESRPAGAEGDRSDVTGFTPVTASANNQLTSNGYSIFEMPFTAKDFKQWHAAKLRHERKPRPIVRPEPVTECSVCGNPFGYGEGVISDLFPICDICDGDD
jgi:hypothetical protein